MKHARPDYDQIQDPAGLIPEDEPVFLLRGQDVLAPKLLDRWAKKLLAKGGSIEMADIVFKHAEAMLRWQATHKKKVPDLPQLPKSE
jgi:hypothetical protein